MNDEFHNQEHRTLRDAIKDLQSTMGDVKLMAQRNQWLLGGILIALIGNSGASALLRILLP